MDEPEKSNLYDVELYRLYKAEIEREDTVAYYRSISALTFQGFLFASATFLISNPWFTDPAVAIYPLRKYVLALQGLAGFAVGLATAVGVMAAASSIRSVSNAYDRKVIPKNPNWPQLHGGERQSKLGANFPIWLHFGLAILWAVYEVILIGGVLAGTAIAIVSSLVLLLIVVTTFVSTRRYLEKAPD